MTICCHHNSPGRLHTVGRRNFLAAAGASAVALKTGVFDFASSLFAGPQKRTAKPRIRSVFVRPGADEYWMGWPGASYDFEARQAEYIQTLADAAEQLAVQLELDPTPVHDPQDVEHLVARLRSNPPDGLIITLMHLKDWPQVEYIAENRGDLPVVIHSPLGTSFTESHEATRKLPRTFVAATPEPAGLAFAVRMLNALWEIQHTRICMISDVGQGDQRLSPSGTVLHYVPLSRWPEEVAQVDMTDELRQIATYYAVEAKDIVEPEKEDLFEAVRNYVAARRIMAAENCQAISVDCARLVGERRVACGPCLAWSRLLDEGRVGACEADWRAALSLLLVRLLFDRPGFMQDSAPDTINNTLIGSHCTCATKLAGFDQPHEPYVLRTHAESGAGVALRVLWREDQAVTMLRFQSPVSLLLGTGRVVGNADSSRGGCRTAVEVKMDGVVDSRDVKGHHQVFAYGKLDGSIKAFCQLAGIEVVPV